MLVLQLLCLPAACSFARRIRKMSIRDEGLSYWIRAMENWMDKLNGERKDRFGDPVAVTPLIHKVVQCLRSFYQERADFGISQA